MSMLRRSVLNVSVLLVCFLFSAGVYAQQPRLSLVTAALPPLGSSDGHQGFLERIAREAFGRIGFDVEIHSLPGERALINANSGIDDGDLYRAPGFEGGYANLVKVPERIGVMEFMAYTKTLEIEHMDWKAMAPYVVAYANGWKIYERRVNARETTVVRSINELIPLLEKGRADLVLMDRWQGLEVIRRQGVRIKMLEPPLARVDMFMYLHKRHAQLIPRLTAALRQMKRDGTYDRIFESVFQKYK